MAQKDLVKRYEKDGFTIVWRPGKCIHSEVCAKTLPNVYRPKEKPWIQPESASIQELKSQIDLCPSGALSYEHGGKQDAAGGDLPELQVIKGGPLMVKCAVKLEGIDGTMQTLEGKSAFCRCGASANKPFCDGSHRKVSFE